MQSPIAKILDLNTSDYPNIKVILDVFEVSHETDPTDINVYTNLGLALHNQCFFEAAFTVFNEAITLNAESTILLNYQGDTLYELNRFEEAIETYTKAILLDNKDPEGYVNLARVLRRRSRPNEGLEACQKALQLNPKLVAAYICQSEIYITSDNKEKANEAFDAATDFCPLFQDLDNNLGLKLYEEGKVTEAVEVYNSNVILSYKWVFLYFRIAFSLNKTSIMNKVEKVCYLALQANSRNFYAYFSLGFIFNKQEHNQAAIQFYKHAVILNPKHSLCYYNLANTLRRVGNISQAIEAVQKATILDPKNINAFYNLGHIMNEQDRTDEAEEAYRSTVNLKPSHVNAWYNLGLIYNKKRDYKKAIHAFTNVVKHNPRLGFGYLHLSNNYSQCGNVRNAVHFIQKVFRLNPTNIAFKDMKDAALRSFEESKYELEDNFV